MIRALRPSGRPLQLRTIASVSGPSQVNDVSDERLGTYRLTAKLLRERNTFVAESRQVVSKLLRGGKYRVQSLLCTPAALEDLQAELEPYPHLPIYLSTSSLIKELTKVGRGCVAVVDRPDPTPLASLLAAGTAPKRLCALETVADPDNVGGIFRSAQAFGFGGVLLSSSSADPLYRKAVRTSLAATASLPFSQRESGPGWSAQWSDDLQLLRERGYRTVALTPGGRRSVRDAATELKDERVALLLGNEGFGLSPETLSQADELVAIPTAGDFSSLNVMVAASIAMHHFAVP